MNFNNFIVKSAIPFCCLIFAACAADDDAIIEHNAENSSSESLMTFSANMDSEDNLTRVSFNSNSAVWSAGDNIYIYIYNSSVNNNQEGEFSIVPQDIYTKEANFKGPEISKNTGWNSQNVYYSMYPSNGSGMIKKNTSGLFGTTTSYVFSGSIPTVQEAVIGSYDQKLHYMTARSSSTTLSFKNVCALLKVEIKNNDNSNFNVSRIKVVANLNMSQTRGNGLFGSFQELNAPQYSTINIAGDFSSTIGNDGAATTQITGNASTFVELRGATTTTNGKEVLSPLSDGVYYLVVLPSAINNGFTLLLEDVEGNKAYQRVSTKVTSFVRNNMYNLGTYDISTFNADNTLANVVDLGLPSGTLWCMNDVPDADGDNSETKGFFAWGETVSKAKTFYDWDYSETTGSAYQHYIFGRGSVRDHTIFTSSTGNGTLAKYFDEFRGNWGSWNLFDATYDNRFELESEDDVVTQRNGASFCMPTQFQAAELRDNSVVKNADGKFTISGKGDYSSKNIIFNSGGYISKSTEYDFNETGIARFWTNTRGEDRNSQKAHSIKIDGNSMSIETVERVEGRKAHGVVKR